MAARRFQEGLLHQREGCLHPLHILVVRTQVSQSDCQEIQEGSLFRPHAFHLAACLRRFSQISTNAHMTMRTCLLPVLQFNSRLATPFLQCR